MMRVATPETTAWDLVRYPRAAGGLDNVITVLAELSEKLSAKKVRATAENHGDVVVAQRLGYLLDHVGRHGLAKGLAEWVKDAPARPLDPGAPARGAVENRKWHLLVNVELEPEA
jgi:predicted transcriptional regulator of viral defense system